MPASEKNEAHPRPSGVKYVVGRLEEIPPGERLIVRVRGRSYGVFNVAGKLYALLNRCPHHGAELCKGALQMVVESDAPGSVRFDSSRWLIQCPWHGWEFDIETGRSYTEPGKSRVRSFPAAIQGGAGVADDVAAGSADTRSREIECIVPGPVHNTVVSSRDEAPLQVEPLTVSVEDDFVVLHLPR